MPEMEHDPSVIRAKRLLRHYFQMIAERAGVRLDSDCLFEIDDIVNCIMNAAWRQTTDILVNRRDENPPDSESGLGEVKDDIQ